MSAWVPIAGVLLALIVVTATWLAGVAAPRRCAVPLIGALLLLVTGCGDLRGMISEDPQGHLEPGDAPEGAPDHGYGEDPTQSPQPGRLQPGDPEAPRGETSPWEAP